jgi:hypothetical protein
MNARIKLWISVIAIFALGMELVIAFHASNFGLSSLWREVVLQLSAYTFLFLLIFSFLNVIFWFARVRDRADSEATGSLSVLLFKLIGGFIVVFYALLVYVPFSIILPWLSYEMTFTVAVFTVLLSMLGSAVFTALRQWQSKKKWRKKRLPVAGDICYEGISQKHEDSALKYLRKQDWRNAAHYFWLAAETLSQEPSPDYGFGVAWLYLLSSASYIVFMDSNMARKALELGRQTIVSYELKGSSKKQVSMVFEIVNTLLSGDKEMSEQKLTNLKRQIKKWGMVEYTKETIQILQAALLTLKGNKSVVA